MFYYNIIFLLLTLEIAFFTVLSLPWPRAIRRRVLSSLSMPFRNEKVQVTVKCFMAFVLVLFFDACQRTYAVTQELNIVKEGARSASNLNVVTDRDDVQARKFYAQRNMYLCGFTLFFTLVITRTFSLVSELIVTKDKVDALKPEDGSAEKGRNSDSSEVEALKKQLSEKEQNLEILKSQADSLSKDYLTASEKKA